MLSIRDYLIVLITNINTSHKTHLLSDAFRCSSKLQKIQSLENFVSMAIQGTLVPKYTKHTHTLNKSNYSKNKSRQFSENTLTHVKPCDG